MTLQTTGINALEQVRAFVEGNQAVSFVLKDRRSAHHWLMETLKRFRYERCSKIDKGLLRAYMCKVTGLSRAQATRLIAQQVASMKQSGIEDDFALNFLDSALHFIEATAHILRLIRRIDHWRL